MTFFSRFAVLGLAGSLVAACSSIDLDATKKMSLSGDKFQNALFMEYVDLARMEDEEVDTKDAVYFNDRAKMAAAGKDSGPQALADRKIPSGAAADLAAARKALTAALSGGAAKGSPKQAARAQAMFDCWMQEQEENDQPRDIAACRAAFETAMKGLKPAKKKKKAKKKAKPQDFVVFFGHNSDTLDDDATGTVFEVMAASDGGRRSVMLMGHADTSGDKKYNEALAERRVNAVKEALLGVGIDAANIQAQSFGENKPAVPTGDGARNANNRRVNVTVK